MALPKNLQDREMAKFVEDASGDVAIRSGITVQDIQIGAVELKNYNSDNRQGVNSSHEALVKNPPLEVLVGEVQASPTANTLLDRLKTIASAQLPDGHKVALVGNSSPDGSGTEYHLITDNSGRIHTRSFRNAEGNGRRMLVDDDRHGQVDVLSMPSTDKIGSGIQHATINITAAGAGDIIGTPGVGHHLRIKAFSISSKDTADSEFELRDDTNSKFKYNIPKDGGNIVVNLIGANWDITANKALTIFTAGVTDLYINVSYEDITD